MTEHRVITDAQLHEIKGAASASAGTVPIANGSGGAPFGVLPINYSYTLNLTVDDISVLNKMHVVVPTTGTLSKVQVVADVATAGGTGVSFVPKINGAAVTDGTVTIPNAAAVGTAATANPTGGNTPAAGAVISIDVAPSQTTLPGKATLSLTISV